MLETRNLVKIYKPKKGVPVTALNGINLKFPKTGMVFILGKSGSGKSTLLNVLGGLDGFTSGDILVKGESTKGFKQKGYDSYRNTYVGFIFQEYNVIEEFSVGANIALAIELQGRKATDEEINKILSEVDLCDFATRKPNELSGGQKQRVAIARALVKNPEIIMADEPTGALDSVTGKQVLDTLKELSKTKLVIVVSHDREFAETYANRIIELADGNVISDVTKSSTTNDEVEEKNVEFKENSITIKHGYQLTEEDRIAINEYLLKLKTDVTINSTSKKTKSSSKFIDTNVDNIETDNSGFKLIKSRLSLKNSIKIGASSFKHKRGKLIVTIILSIVAFSLFGFSDACASFGFIKNTTKSIIDSNIDYASYVKQIKIESGTGINKYTYYNDLLMSEDDVKSIKNDTGLDFKGVFQPATSDFQYNVAITNNTDDSYKSNMFYSYFSGFAESNKDELNSFGYSIVGEYPNGLKNEIAITDYTYEFFKEVGYYPINSTNIQTTFKDLKPEDEIKIEKKEDLIGKTLYIGNYDYTITGIVNTNFDYERYRKLAERSIDEISEASELILYYALSEELWSATSYTLNNVAFVGEGFIENYKKNYYPPIAEYYLQKKYDEVEIANDWWDIYCRSASSVSLFNQDVFYFDENKTSLNDDEILISPSILNRPSFFGEDSTLDPSMINKYLPKKKFYDGNSDVTFDFSEYASFSINEQIINLAAMRYVANIPDIQAEFNKIVSLESAFYSREYDFEAEYPFEYQKACFILGYYANTFGWDEYLPEIQKDVENILVDVIRNDANLLEKATSEYEYEHIIFSDIISSTDVKLKIAGIFSTAKFHYDDYRNLVLLSENKCNEELDLSGCFSYAVTKMPTNKNDVKKLVEKTYGNKGETIRYYLSNPVCFEMDAIAEILEVISIVFLFIGIGFAIFASLMFANFIANSISYKKHDIGILRAIGSSSGDVYRIFFAESAIIALINYVGSMIIISATILIVNYVVRYEVNLLITVLTLGFRQFILIFGVCILSAALATFFPVMKNARKKPIDAIRGR